MPLPNASVAENLAGTTAVVLAGGLGTRLRSVTGDRPKVLAEVAGRPFLAYLLDLLGDAGVREVVLCTGYRAELISGHFGASYKGLTLSYSQEPSQLGTGGAMRHAQPQLRSDPVLVLNGDSYCAADLPAFFDWHRRTGSKASLLLTEVPDSSRYGRVEVDGEGTVLGFTEKAASGGPGWINAGIYLFSRPFFRALPEITPLSLEREVFPAWVGRGLHGYRSKAWFIDVGTPESYALAEQTFAGRGTR